MSKNIWKLTVKGYNPDQPRVPAGQSGGGRWTSTQGTLAGTLNGAELHVVKHGQRLTAEQIARTDAIVLSPDGTLIVQVGEPRIGGVNHTEIIQWYEGTQENYDRYVRGRFGEREGHPGQLEFQSDVGFMGVGNARSDPNRYQGLTQEVVQQRAWKNFGRMARALRNAGFPPDAWMYIWRFFGAGQPLEASIMDAVEYKSLKKQLGKDVV